MCFTLNFQTTRPHGQQCSPLGLSFDVNQRLDFFQQNYEEFFLSKDQKCFPAKLWGEAWKTPSKHRVLDCGQAAKRSSLKTHNAKLLFFQNIKGFQYFSDIQTQHRPLMLWNKWTTRLGGGDTQLPSKYHPNVIYNPHIRSHFTSCVQSRNQTGCLEPLVHIYHLYSALIAGALEKES